MTPRPAATLAAFGLLAMLGACASDPVIRAGSGSAIETIADRAATRLLRLRGPAPATPAAAPAPLTRAAIDASPRPLRIITLETRNASDAVAETLRSGDTHVYLTGLGLLFAFREGQLVATRGFGQDLMSAAVPPAAALRSGSGTHRRVHDYLSGTDQTIRAAFDCTLTPAGTELLELVGLGLATTVVVERCTGQGLSFENRYWFDRTGRLRQARQWMSPAAGYLIAADPMR